MKTFFVYTLLRSDIPSQPIFYVGKGQGNRPTRHFHSRSRKLRCMRNFVITKVLSEGGSISSEIVFTTTSEDEAFAEERRLIALYGRADIGTGFLTNHTDGGEGTSGHMWSKESREKLSIAISDSWKRRRRRELTPEIIAERKRRKSESNKAAREKRLGRPNFTRHIKHSEEQREYWREAHKRSRKKHSLTVNTD